MAARWGDGLWTLADHESAPAVIDAYRCACEDAVIISSDPEVHADRIREAEQLGATTMALINVSGADPHRAIEVYGVEVLPVSRRPWRARAAARS